MEFQSFINDSKLCDYGCNQIALYSKVDWQKKHKFCCSSTFYDCPGRKKNQKAKWKEIDETGLTRKQRQIAKAIKTKESKIDPETGLNLLQLAGLKSGQTQKKINPRTGNTFALDNSLKTRDRLKLTINPQTGLSHYEKVGKKISTTLNFNKSIVKKRGEKFSKLANSIDETTGLKNSELWAKIRLKNDAMLDPLELQMRKQISSDKRCKTMNNKFVKTDDELISVMELSRRNMVKSLFETFDENGLSVYEKSQIRYNKLLRYKNTNILYNSSNEMEFLDDLCYQYGTDWMEENVIRPKPIKYTNLNTKQEYLYYLDFLVRYTSNITTAYEIKSSWTFDNNGQNFDLRLKNIAKLHTAIKKLNCATGYFIVDGYMIECPREIPERFL